MSNSNQFACELYKQLAREGGNLFFSPFSIKAALTRPLIGARGETGQQMRQVLDFGERVPPTGIALQVRQQETVLRECSAEGIRLAIANRLWAQQDFDFNQSYLDVVGPDGIEMVDFRSDPDAIAEAINQWIAENTNYLIRDMVSPGVLDAMVRLVIANAIYFKGLWGSQFDPEKTRLGEFKVDVHNSVQTEMMHQTAHFGYLDSADGLKVLEMPYKGDRLSMVVFLPDEVSGLERIEQNLTPANLGRWLNGLRAQKVRVTFPKFKITWGTKELTPALMAMGMLDAFSMDADFSGIEPTRYLYISNVMHKAFVNVDEEGTEAAAATVVVMRGKSVSPPIPEFRADHPFAFVIYDKATGTTLFMGRVADPTA